MQKFKIDCGMDMENSKVFVMHFNGKRGINYNHLVLLFNGEVFNKAVRGYKGYATTKCPIKISTELDEDDDALTIEWRYNCLDIKSIQDAKVFIKFVYLCKKFLKKHKNWAE